MTDGVDAYTRGSVIVVNLVGEVDRAQLDGLAAALRRLAADDSDVRHAIVDLTQASFRDAGALTRVLDVVTEGSKDGNARLVCNRLMGRVMLAQAQSSALPVFDSVRAASAAW